MAKKQEAPQPELPIVPADWSAPLAEEATTVDQAKADLDIGYPHIKTAELKHERFTIVGLQSFKSTLSPDVDPFFALCRDDKTGELFTTVLGGKQPVEFLSAYLAKGGNKPLQVYLNFVEQGTYDGYYVIE